MSIKKATKKAISYRIGATTLGCIVTYLWTHKFFLSVGIAITVAVTNFVFYILHELGWRDK